MLGKRAVLKVGTLDVKGPLCTFTPAKPLDVRAVAGDEVEVVLAYRYAEADLQKESCRIQFRAALEGRADGWKEVRIGDRPLVDDTASGTLAHVVRPAAAGRLKGAFAVEVTYLVSSWADPKKIAGRDFRAEGLFFVDAA